MPTVTTVLVAVVNLIFVADLLRTKLALTPTTTTTTISTTITSTTTTTTTTSSSSPFFSSFSPSSSSSSYGQMDGGSRGQGHGLRDVLRPTTTTATDTAMLSGDVSDDDDLTLGSGSGVYLPEVETETSPHSQILHTLKDDRRGGPQSTCCFIGKLAASRQLHCLAQYHVDKLHVRRGGSAAGVTAGRQGVRRSKPHSGDLPPLWARDFRRCVLQKPLVFQKCCYGYATARSDRLRWYNHRKARTGSIQNSYHAWRYIYS
ncbi:uncharacterized protein LOC143291834 [Babylonia areolata]|uniref:uncharacterized protein LOC143291834 n=1 Tax=Babylonia areolata TaxID=304850 RepID=UPI003FD22333